jgi:lipopolysaccharide biosynthesis glycosyltransferase
VPEARTGESLEYSETGGIHLEKVKSTYVTGCNGRVDLEPMSRSIVLACDEAYAMPLATALRSIVEANHKRWPLDVHVLSDGFSEGTQRRVLSSLPKGSASIRWVPVDLGNFQEFSTLSYISKMTYARFLIPHIFQDTASRVLYLDADIIVLDDLEQLWETNLNGAVVGAVLDGLDTQLKNNKPGLENVPRVRDYFNAGVLLIDLDRWRKERISEKALEYLARNPLSPFSDQDALNVACDKLWKKMDPRWNLQDYYEKKRLSEMNLQQRPGIVHFVTREKPWDPRILHLNADFYDAFRSRTYFARTPQDKILAMVRQGWFNLKSVLRKYAFLRVIWERTRVLKRRPITTKLET